jgi:hypothetical protein
VYVLEFGSARFMFKNLDENKWKKFQLKILNKRKFFSCMCWEKNAFWDISTKTKIGILLKLVHLEASTKLHAQKKIHEFFIYMVFIMAYPNFKKGLRMAFSPLGIKPIWFGTNFKNWKKNHLYAPHPWRTCWGRTRARPEAVRSTSVRTPPKTCAPLMMGPQVYKGRIRLQLLLSGCLLGS